MYHKLTKFIFVIISSLFFFFLDKFSKDKIIDLLINDKLPIKINEFLNIISVWNTGFSFGFLSNYAIKPLYIVFFTLSVLIIVMSIIKQFPIVIQGMIIGGAIGNIYDRYSYNAVLDFIDFHVGDWHYPAFNFADSFIVIAIFYIIIDQIRLHYKTKKN